MLRRIALAIAVLALVLPGSALAAEADLAFEGGSKKDRAQVHAALATSSFDWGLVQEQVMVHIGPYGTSHATPGHVWLDAGLLRTGKFGWATVMDEFAHQIDFFVLDDSRRLILQNRLGAQAWCYEVAGLGHAAHGRAHV